MSASDTWTIRTRLCTETLVSARAPALMGCAKRALACGDADRRPRKGSRSRSQPLANQVFTACSRSKSATSARLRR